MVNTFSKLAENKNLDFLKSINSLKPPTNHAISQLFVQIKTHKSGFPIRALVNSRLSPAINFEKAVTKYLSTLVDNSTIRLKSSKDLVSKLPLSISPSTRLYVVDIKNMFPSIPPFDSHMVAISKVLENYTIYHNEILALKTGLEALRKFSIFVWNSTVYKQEEGLNMGSPLSPILAEIFIQHVEEEFILNNNLVPDFVVRYVDDYLIFWNHGDIELRKMFNRITDKYPFLDFTIDIDQDGNLNYLDLSLTIKQNNLFFSVYHKEIGHPIIPFNSNVPLHLKASVFIHMYLRAISHSSTDQYFKEEMKWIVNLGANNGYSKNFIYKFLYNYDCKNHKRNLDNEDKSRLIGSLEFSSNTYSLKNIFRKFGYDIAIKPKRNLLSSIICDRDARPVCQRAGVYSIPITSNNNTYCYIGSTGRNIKIRIDEHKKKFSSWKDGDSNISNSIIEFVKNNSDSTIIWEETSIIKPYKSKAKLRIQESLAILTKNPINKDLPFNLNNTWIKLLNYINIFNTINS